MTLPEGWIETTFDIIATYIQRGKSPKYTEKSGLAVINQKSIRWHGIRYEDLKYVHPEQWSQWPEERYAKLNDILWNSTGTGTIGRACLIEDLVPGLNYVVDSHVTILRFPKEIEPKYVFYWIMSPAIQEKIDSMYTGTTNQVELGKKVIQDTIIPLSPLKEQRRIVAKLEAVLAKVQSAQAHLDKIPSLLKRTRQAILSAAVSGKLTENWREGNKQLVAKVPKTLKFNSVEMLDPEESYLPELPGQWYWIKLKDIGHVQTGIAKNAGKKLENPLIVPYLRVANVQDGFLNLDELKEITIESSNLDRYLLKKGDILFCEGGDFDKVGRGTVWENEIERCVHQNHVFSVRLKSDLCNPYFLSFYRSSEFAKRYFVQSAKQTTNLASINSTQLKEFLIPYCAIEEQQEIVQRVEALFERLHRIEAAYQTAKAKVDAINQSTLAKAFRGELVPQELDLDPNAEPASVLLERIKAERAAQAKAPKPKNKVKRVSKKENVISLEGHVEITFEVTGGLTVNQQQDLLETLKKLGKPMTPEALLREAGYGEDTDSIEAFYKALKQYSQAEKIQEEKLSDRKVLLSAIGHEN